MDIKAQIRQMPVEDRIALCSGKNFWQTKEYPKYGIPSVFMCDGPHGLRKQENDADMLGINKSRKATCFPAEVTTAGSWDTSLLERIGRAIAEEAAEQKVGIVLGPGVNIKRNPLCGRNFEYFSEDPYLAGKLGAAYIQGVEGEGVSSCVKHFACNSQETGRLVSDGIIDERTLREIYLYAFEIAVREGRPSSLMCAYPKINGIHCSDNKKLLTDILRTEWGYEGAVMTDWGAMNDRIEGFRAGCDLNMPGGSSYMEKESAWAVKCGELSEEKINESAERVTRLALRGYRAMTGKNCDYEAHHSLCREAAVSGAVLLKNDDGLLPIKENCKVAVIGYMAKNMRYQGTGSSHINPVRLSQPADFFPDCVYAHGCDEKGNTTELLLKEAEKAALSADIAVVFAGLPDSYESEGFDRDNMKLPEGHVRMIEAVARANSNTAVVLLCGSAVECPWADTVKSILYMGLPGQAGGEAAAELIYGRSVPSGKLAESWPLSYDDVSSSEIFNKTRDALYEEGIYVGYRYYDKAEMPVRWKFGFGMSYTSFAYTNLRVNANEVRVTVENTGVYDAAEVVQVYVCPPKGGIHRPVRELKNFRKIFLKKGEKAEVRFVLDDRSFSIYQDGWKVPKGIYEICVGDLKASVEINGTDTAVPEWQPGSFYETCRGKPVQSQWEQMIGKKYALETETGKGYYTMENSVEEMRKHSLVMKIMYAAVKIVLKKGCGAKDDNDPEFRMMLASSVGGPLRSIYISSGVQGGVFPGLLEMANGNFFRGIAKMLGKQ